MANDLLVRILGDTKGLEQSFARANTVTTQFGRNVETTGAKVDKVGKSFRNLGTAFAGGFVASEVLRGMKAAIDVASSLQEQISASNVVFEDSAGVIQDWARTTADSIGVAEDQALTAANTFGSIFDAAGQSAAGAAELSKAVVQLGGDLASFADTSVEDALQALRSGLSGEIEPLRRFRVFLTEAAVAAEAMAQSGKNSAAELTQGEKIMARWSLILKQTNNAQGDAARTADSYANQTRRLSANMRDLQASAGGPLLRVLNSLVADLISGADAAQKLGNNLSDLANVVVPVIEIPFKFVGIGAAGGKGPSQIESAAKTLFTGSLPGIIGLLDDAIRAEGIFAAPAPKAVNKTAKAFEENFDSFTESLDKALKGAKGKVDQEAGKVKSFGEKGFKPLTESLKQANEHISTQLLDALDFKLDQAAITPSLADDLGVLQAIKTKLEGMIAAGIKVRDSTKKLGKVIKEIASIQQEQKDEAADAFLGGLQLNIDKAGLTATLRDDIIEMEAYKRGLEKLIKQGQDVAENESKLVQVTKDIAEARKTRAANIKEAALAAAQRSQFRALGLSATGEEMVPGAKNLAKRIEGVLDAVATGQGKVSSKIVTRLKLARALIKKEGANMSADVRSVINDLIKDVTGDFAKAIGPRTATSSLNANKFLEGLGLGRDLEKELRARLSSFNSAGKALAGGGTRPTGQFVGGPTIVVENHNTVQLDDDVVARSVTKSQQKSRRRNTKQKRGPNSGV